MNPDGPSNTPGLPSPGDLIAQQKKDAIQAAGQPTGDGGLFSQLTNNPFFTAVCDLTRTMKSICRIGMVMANVFTVAIRDSVSLASARA